MWQSDQSPPAACNCFRRTHVVIRCIAALALAIADGGVAAFAQSSVPVGQYGDWMLMSDDREPKTTCFVVSQPKATEPKGVTREPAFFYISTWPNDGVKAEIGIKLGFKPKKDSDATLSIGNTNFLLAAQDDRLYAEDATRELKLIEALRKAPQATLQATTERGGTITDTYSLNGLTQALQALAATCP